MKTVAVFFGGRSAEHDVSIVTALATVIKPLELSKKYRVEAVYIAKDGAWYWDDRLKDISLFSSGRIDAFIRRSKPAGVQFDGGMMLTRAGGLTGGGQRRRIDVAFPAMHGTYGEDGALMGLLDMAGVPYVGCSMSAAVLAMDKALAKQIVQAEGIMTPAFRIFGREAITVMLEDVVKETTKSLTYPLFIKPAHLGSSIGISRAKNVTELQNGLEVAARFDDKIVVEEAVNNLIEVTLPIIGNNEPVPAYVERPLTHADDFFDFETKYMGQGGKKSGGKQTGAKQGAQGYSTIPADLGDKLYKRVEDTGLAVYRALGCSGIARVDMLIDSKAGTVYFNEVNPLPGSLYAHNWRQKGISNVALVTRLVTLAEHRSHARHRLSTAFSTNFLKQF